MISSWEGALDRENSEMFIFVSTNKLEEYLP